MGSWDNNAAAVGHAWPDAQIGWIAAGQKTLITHDQLLEVGVSRSAISRAVRRGRLYRVHRAVYALVAPQARPQWAAELAAVLAHGPLAILSHAAAARVHGLLATRAVSIDVVLVSRGHHQSTPGIVVHRTTAMHPQERTRRHGLPLTSVARTVIDLSPILAPAARGQLLDEALKRTSYTKLREALDRHPGRPGTPALKALLTGETGETGVTEGRPSARAASDPEKQLLALIRRALLPTPESNVTLANGYRPDLLWAEQCVIAEYDSREHHSGPYAFTSDRTRHNDLTAQGYTVLHITSEQMSDHSEQVLVWIAQALARAE